MKRVYKLYVKVCVHFTNNLFKKEIVFCAVFMYRISHLYMYIQGFCSLCIWFNVISSYYRSYIQINIDIIQQTYLLFENNKYLSRTRKISYLKSSITSKKPIHFSKNGCVFQNVFLQCSLSYNVNLVHRTLKCILDPLS